MTIDNSPTSPFRDRIYVAWTLFAADGTGYIYEVHSDDYGQTFSSPVLVSTTSSLCANTFGLPTPQGTCNENQFSDPFTGPTARSTSPSTTSTTPSPAATTATRCC